LIIYTIFYIYTNEQYIELVIRSSQVWITSGIGSSYNRLICMGCVVAVII
jgi:hypothetical protein